MKNIHVCTFVCVCECTVYFSFLFAFLGDPCRAEDVIQDKPRRAPDGQPLNLSCEHSSLTTHTIFWYRQFPNGALQKVISGYYSGAKSDGVEGVLTISTDRKSNVFSITRVTLADSAVYFCALSDTVMCSGAPAVQ